MIRALLVGLLVLAPAVASAAPRIIYVRFDETEVKACDQDDPVENCVDEAHDLKLVTGPPFVTAPPGLSADDQAEIIAGMRSVFEGFNVRITNERPLPDVEYDMVVIGMPSPPPAAEHLRDGPIDCFDAAGPQIAFVWSGGNLEPWHWARDAASAVAHTWGLEAVGSGDDDEVDSDFMSTRGRLNKPMNTCIGVADWGIELVGEDIEATAECPGQHNTYCTATPPNPATDSYQNSFKELHDLWGPVEPDAGTPSVEIVEPEQRATVGSDFTLVLHVTDNWPPPTFDLRTTLDNDDSYTVSLAGSDHSLELTDISEGDHALLLEAIDSDGNIGTAELVFTVGDAPAPGDGGTESGGDSGADATGDDTSTARGCSCAAAPTSAAQLLLLPLLYRRRRMC